ncbi:MAG: hypothetical protein AABW89_03890 [Nanoarchaeota archaeon]
MNKEHFYKLGYIFFLNLSIITLLLMALNQFEIITLWRFLTESIIFSILVISIGLYVLFKSKFNEAHHTSSKSINSFFHVAPYFFLAILITLAINQFAKLEIITLRNMHLTVLGIFFGFFAFYSNRNRIEQELENEKKKEEDEEKERAEEFEYRFPRINHIWGLRRIVKWMYNEGWWYSWGLIGIVLLFLAIRIFIVLFYGVSFLDEYLHIFTGIELIKTGHLSLFEVGTPYYRGFYVSFLSAIVYFAFGNNLLFFKFIPITIGLLNFFLLKKVVNKLDLKKSTAILLLLIYSIFPLTLFNHTYLRMFVFYETFALLIILLFIKFELNKFNIFILSIISIFLLITKELSTIIFLGLILFYLTNYLIVKLKKLDNSFFIFSLVSTFVFLKVVKLPSIIDGRGSYLRLTQLFIDHLPILTILFFVSIFIIFKDKDFNKRTVMQGIFLLGWVFLVLPEEYMVLRGIFYYVSLLLIMAFYSLNHIKLSNLFYRIIVISILLQVLFTLSFVFNSEGYKIKGEIDYFHYSKFYADVYSECQNRVKLFAIHSPYISRFYGVEEDYIIDLREELLTQNNKFVKDLNGDYLFLFGNKSVISNIDKLNEIVKNNKICLITAKELRHTAPYILKDDFNNLAHNLTREDFKSLILYKN